MRGQEVKHRAKQFRFGRSIAQAFGIQPGRCEQTVSPPLVGQGSGKRLQGDYLRIVRVCAVGVHRLNCGKGWERSSLAKILVVEDNALNIKLFCDLLNAHGHQTCAVVDSREALDRAREFQPELIITDIQLPHVSGQELIRLFRADPQLETVPIMAVTAYAGVGDDERIRAVGASSYVSKPISVVKFIRAVEELLTQPVAEG